MRMKKHIILIIALLSISVSFAQDRNQERINQGSSEEGKENDNSEKSFREIAEAAKEAKEKRPPIIDYKIISIQNDTTFVDTTLTIQKDYKFNYLRRDDFELQPIHNVGQTYNSLAKREERDHLLPLFGARARHFNFMEVGDINYYEVPTPLTELYFRTTFEQGQQLDAFFTVNTSPRLNLSVAYKGVRSLGKYQHALTSTGNFRATASYSTKNNRYRVKTHFVSQDLLNEENGGLSTEGIDQYLGRGNFVGEEDEFVDRGSISVNFEDAENTLLGKRFYLNHQFALLPKKDSTNTEVVIGHILDMTDKRYKYDQAAVAPDDLLGASYVTSNISDNVALEDFSNQVYLGFTNTWLGHLKVIGGSSNYNYGYNTVLTQVDNSGNQTNITNRIKGDVYSVGGEYQNTYKGFSLFADGMTLVSGDFTGNYFNAGAGFKLYDKYEAVVKLGATSVAPNYNFLLYQSDYVNYNWQNDFNNTETQKIQFNIKANKIAEIEASYSIIDNYTFFRKNSEDSIEPLQLARQVLIKALI